MVKSVQEGVGKLRPPRRRASQDTKMETRLLCRLQGRPAHPRRSSLHMLLTDYQRVPVAFIPKSTFLKTSMTWPRHIYPLKGTPFSLTVPVAPITTATILCFGELPGTPSSLLSSISVRAPISKVRLHGHLPHRAFPRPSFVTNLPLPNHCRSLLGGAESYVYELLCPLLRPPLTEAAFLPGDVSGRTGLAAAVTHPP